jgi:lysophospholipase L1-like esterase
MTRSPRSFEYVAAASLAVVAIIISPLGISFFTSRPSLTFRVIVVSLTLDLFLVSLIAAVLARERWRWACFYALAAAFPFAVLAALEAAAISIHLADRIAPLENTLSLARKGSWPSHLTGGPDYSTEDGLGLYRPWHGDGIDVNALGLRTAMPTPKASGEWRVAVTGGSAAWGYRVLDADTIPARMQELLRHAGHANVTVYSFGIEGATLKRELALLKRFCDTYEIDQVLFYTGGNDVVGSYNDHLYGYLVAPNSRPGRVRHRWQENAAGFELIKLVSRLQAMWREPSPQLLRFVDEEVLPKAVRMNSLRRGVAAADDYCRMASLRCDFVLQPVLYLRKTDSEPEAKMTLTLRRIYPRIDVLTVRMYRDAVANGPVDRIHDFSHIFDQSIDSYFLDLIHLNEAGNRAVANHLASIVSRTLH